MIVYKIQNKLNGKIYIGQTITDLNQRISKHTRMNYYIGAALRKYGIQCFDISIIDVAEDHKTLCDKEREYIKFYNSKSPNGYNLTDGGDGLCGHHHSEETKQKISAAFKGKPISEEAKRRRQEAHQIHTEEHKRKISAALMGKPKSDEAKRNMSTAQKRRLRKPFSKQHKRNISVALEGKPWTENRRLAQIKRDK